MTTQIIVVEDIADWKFEDPGAPVVHVDDYLTGSEYFKLKNVQVINLCRSYRYLSIGYYCSLLSEARKHRPLPSVKSMLDLSSKAMYSLDAVNLDEQIQKGFKRRKGEAVEPEFRLDIFFGQCAVPALADLARQIFETFPAPLLRVTFEHQDKWRLTAIKPLAVSKLGKEAQQHFGEALTGYLKKRWRSKKSPARGRYDLAILYNPADPQPPSDKKALQNFIKVGRTMGVDVELIEKKDYARLAEFDALFIRDTTRINHYTYRFAKKAESEGMVVIDDPISILRCTNKVYLAELLRANKVPTPKTVIAGGDDLDAVEAAIGYPMVLKVPDGSFSQGVVKAENREDMLVKARGLLKNTELILAQEFLYTAFDWRIGVLNRRPIYACQYFMSKKHWQIVNYTGSGVEQGAWKTWPVEQVPRRVVNEAVKAASLIGDGLYGVDMKQTERGVYVIEVNDNPNIDSDVEDEYLGEDLYRVIIGDFVRRLEQKRYR
jgi:glutathione synthase/RimK-type ligase-like ATP-grasp enzyme